MPDDDDEVFTIIDWIDQANSLGLPDPEEDDDESPGACDEMSQWDLDGDEDEEDDEAACD